MACTANHTCTAHQPGLVTELRHHEATSIHEHGGPFHVAPHAANLSVRCGGTYMRSIHNFSYVCHFFYSKIEFQKYNQVDYKVARLLSGFTGSVGILLTQHLLLRDYYFLQTLEAH